MRTIHVRLGALKSLDTGNENTALREPLTTVGEN